jgi:hypothetical protein
MAGRDRREYAFSEAERVAVCDVARKLEHSLPWEEEGAVPVAHDGRLVIGLSSAGYQSGDLEVFCEDFLDDSGNARLDVEYTFRMATQGLTASVSRSEPMSREPRAHLQTILNMFPGSEVEFDTTQARNGLLKPKSNSWWGETKKNQWKNFYHRSIYPAAVNTVTRIITRLPDADINHVDLFGGNGEFDGLLQTALQTRKRNVYSHIFDRNEDALLDASFRQANKNIIVHPAVDLIKSPDEVWRQSGKPDVVTAIGGLTHLVTTRQDVLPLVYNVYHTLQSGGYFVFTGLMNSNIGAEDLTTAGFTVLQKSIPGNIFTNQQPWQLYVAQK